MSEGDLKLPEGWKISFPEEPLHSLMKATNRDAIVAFLQSQRETDDEPAMEMSVICPVCRTLFKWETAEDIPCDDLTCECGVKVIVYDGVTA